MPVVALGGEAEGLQVVDRNRLQTGPARGSAAGDRETGH